MRVYSELALKILRIYHVPPSAIIGRSKLHNGRKPTARRKRRAA